MESRRGCNILQVERSHGPQLFSQGTGRRLGLATVIEHTVDSVLCNPYVSPCRLSACGRTEIAHSQQVMYMNPHQPALEARVLGKDQSSHRAPFAPMAPDDDAVSFPVSVVVHEA